MKIGGLQKTSLLDYPERISAIIWTVGCNFRCPFCYNKGLVLGNVGLFPEEEFFSFLESRKGLLEGVVITGGEPLLQKDLVDFCKKIKKLGFLVKVDTNGTNPESLKELIDKKLVDYIAMDVKAPFEKYNAVAGAKVDIKKIKASIAFIKASGIDYEFRTTFTPGLLDKDDIISISEILKGAKKYYLQQFKPTTSLLSTKYEKTKPYPDEVLLEILEKIKHKFDICEVRGL